MNRYCIITTDRVAYEIESVNAVEAIIQYAEFTGSTHVKGRLFSKAVSGMDVETAAEFYNAVTYIDSDKIHKLITDYSTLYCEEREKE